MTIIYGVMFVKLPGENEYKELFRTPAFDVIKNGPQGQEIFVQRLPVTFKHNSQLSRTVYFSNYFYWVGDVRDCSAWPGLKGIAQQFSTGNWGMVTNNTKIKIPHSRINMEERRGESKEKIY